MQVLFSSYPSAYNNNRRIALARLKELHRIHHFCNGGKGLKQLMMIVDLKVESSLCKNLAVFGGNYSFLGPTTDGLI